MKALTYDNPKTCCRECWQDGKLICSYAMELIINREIPREYFFFGANIGPWKEGQIWGDIEAMRRALE